MKCSYRGCSTSPIFSVDVEWDSMFLETFNFCKDHAERAKKILNIKKYNYKIKTIGAHGGKRINND